ncbi:hypothetical protein ASG87_11190 [Frateuria sp. Soil773]|uniref:hypothetical protein n=1 Tax=Frateuria sp. Soil773 TaxID=1736407 RepID=UPI0006FC464D|nr:hypothetical protein [Frateuria sp. Soil773]KRF02044.1 hypothetical protein ASG87_11190 [Frateuria sp. Soil773]
MRSKPLRRTLLPLLAVLALAACHDKNDTAAAGGDTPEAAVRQSVALIKAGDFAGFWKHALPPADYATLRSDWGRARPDQKPVTAEDRARFDQTVQKLTAPDAENRLYAELQPKLAEAEQKYKDQLPMMIGVGQQFAKSAIAQNQNLTAQQKDQAGAVLDVLGPWAQQVAWFDPAKARQAVGVAVATARKLDLKSPDAMRTMDFDTAMAKYAIGFDGARQLLATYGLSVDDTLDSVKVTPIETTDDHARVRIDYTLLGKPLSTESALVREDGRWYGEDLLEKTREAHRQLQAPAAAGSAPVQARAPAATAGGAQG